jgi:hypothetical protein
MKNTLVTFAKIPVPEAGRSISVNEAVAASSTPRSCVTSVPLRALMVSTPEYERFVEGSTAGIPADGAASNARNVVAESRAPAISRGESTLDAAMHSMAALVSVSANGEAHAEYQERAREEKCSRTAFCPIHLNSFFGLRLAQMDMLLVKRLSARL